MPKDTTKAAPAPEPDEEPAVPVTVVDPEAGEGDDEVQLVRSGWVRLVFNGETVRLRRPFFGELKALRLALEDMSDAISEHAETTQIVAAEMVEEATAIEKDESLDGGERVKRRREIQRRSRDEGRALTAFADDQRVQWWQQVVETLSVGDGFPDRDELPSWIVDASLPNTVMQHWRSVPLGRG